MAADPDLLASPGTLDDALDHARTVADAVLFEGYVLYPYRASSAKNRMRWQFGVLVPPACTAQGGEYAEQRTDILLEPRTGDRLHAELRFLHVRRRTVERLDPDGTYTEVPELELPDRVLVPWDEGHEERVRLHAPLAELAGEQAHTRTVTFDLPPAVEHEPVRDAEGRTLGRLVRRRARLAGEIRPYVEQLAGPYRVSRLTVTVHNTTDAPAGDRTTALPHSMIGAHLLLAVEGGRFLSMTDPPEWARHAVAELRNDHTWPVLAGPAGREDLVLSSPIILEDHPVLADESPGPLYDATEIDEILSLRTAALTEREKREARGTDDRAAEVIDLVDSMPDAVRERLHGAIRWLREVTDPPGPPAAGLTLPEGTGHPWWDPQQDPEAADAPTTIPIDGEAVGQAAYLSCGFILEEGVELSVVGRVAQALGDAARTAGVTVATGDTKVVDAGHGDGIFINTAGIGLVPDGVDIRPGRAAPGDAVLVSGQIGVHGVAIMSVREGLEFGVEIQSDTASLAGMVADMLGVCQDLHVLRDPTRGGLATSLNEIAGAAGVGITLDERSLPVPDTVANACSFLGLDPLYVANEGKLVAFVPPDHADAVLEAMRAHPLGKEAVRIGSCVEDHPGMVVAATGLGGTRVVDMPLGEQLPRIC